MLNELTPIMKKYAPKRIPVPDVLYEYFIMRSRANLHVVLCFSPVSTHYIVYKKKLLTFYLDDLAVVENYKLETVFPTFV